MAAKKLTVTRWKISELREHPRQAALFGDISDEELRALAEDMRVNGQRVWEVAGACEEGGSGL
jgi:hypothetical protein